jgi:uncharacterized protein (UPF0332 family)
VTPHAADSWARAQDALRLARHDLPLSADGAASWAYYAAFHAVSALFALKGRTFRKHTAVEAAVHRDLVRPGIWPEKLGEAYSDLVELREVGHYGGVKHVTPEEAQLAIHTAADILKTVADANPSAFQGLFD